MDGQQGFRLLGEEEDGKDLMGWSVSRVGDLNGDGLNDMIMGARSALTRNDICGGIRGGKVMWLWDQAKGLMRPSG